MKESASTKNERRIYIINQSTHAPQQNWFTIWFYVKYQMRDFRCFAQREKYMG